MGWWVESSRPCVPKHGVRGFNGSGWRLLCSRDWCLLSETFQTTFSHIERLPRAKTLPFWERQESWLLPIALKTHTIGMDQSTLDISRVLWHHLPMAYKYTPPSGVALCCRDRQDAVIHSWVTRRRREKLHCTIQLSFPFRGRLTCFHVVGSLFALRTGNTLHLHVKDVKTLSCVRWCLQIRSVFVGWQVCLCTRLTLRGISETPSIKSRRLSATLCCGGVWFGTKDPSHL